MTLRETALAALQALHDARGRSDRITEALREEWPDLDGLFLPSPAVEDATIKLIDAALGDTVGSYFLYECLSMKDGGAIEVGGRRYPIRTIDDVRAYLDAEVPDR